MQFSTPCFRREKKGLQAVDAITGFSCGNLIFPVGGEDSSDRVGADSSDGGADFSDGGLNTVTLEI